MERYQEILMPEPFEDYKDAPIEGGDLFIHLDNYVKKMAELGQKVFKESD
mgnify:CR=1